MRRKRVAKNVGLLLAGMLLGSILTASVGAVPGQMIDVYVSEQVRFFFNDELKTLPQDMTVLNHNGRIYTPARFIAEELGADVVWDPITQSVLVMKEEVTEIIEEEEYNDEEVEEVEEIEEEPVEKPAEEEAEEEEPVKMPRGNYETLPITVRTQEVIITLQDVYIDDSETTFYIETEGRINRPVKIDQRSAKIIADGNEYKHSDAENVQDQLDIRWIQKNIYDGEYVDGWIRFGGIDEDVKELYLEFDYAIEDRFPERHTVKFYIDMENS